MFIVYAINTDDYSKIKVERLGYFQGNGKDFSELCRVTYPHPESNGEAICHVLEWLQVEIPVGTSTLFNQCIGAMQGLTKISELKHGA